MPQTAQTFKSHTRFLPPAVWRAAIAPTEYDDQGKMLRGVVHDPTARRMGGVAGRAPTAQNRVAGNGRIRF